MAHQRDDTVSSGAPVPVGVEYVEAQLEELWREVAEAAQVEGGVKGVTATHVLNMIVRAESEDAGQSYMRDVEAVTGLHPNRTIMMVADAHADQEQMPVQAWVSIMCQLPPGGGRQVCAEEVTVQACGDAVRQMPAAVIPLLIPDLPVVLWWPQGAPFDEYLFRNLADSLNRLMVDSATFENPEGTLAKMSGRLLQSWPKMACSDMNWTRLLTWREMTAQFFDSANLRPYLDRINRVTIDFALSERGGVNRAQALLLAGWLASRLHWDPIEPVHELVRSPKGEGLPASTRLYLRSGKRSITMNLNAGPQKSAVAGDIRGVRLEVLAGDLGDGEEVEAAFWIDMSEKEGERAWVCVEIEGLDPTRRHVHIDTPSRADLLAVELEVFSHDRIYEEALAAAGVFIRGLDPSAKQQTAGSRGATVGEPLSAGAAGQARTRPPGAVPPPQQPVPANQTPTLPPDQPLNETPPAGAAGEEPSS
jgi:glucose-6-phosphate dehydrogenase assembly protein OpcA